ncbi:MAG: cob(I)yrinic acid a,c-diamide adenosyltransferase [Candidatus Omnitrophica bacterium]|nr:cob(I)yrinic acid a,c-diamide adenosyltransferase [Candidatus Omnitrophota bacterium]
MKKQGLVQIYTGDGKGKTTAAVGLAVRANAQKFKVCYVSFHKDPQRCGYSEIKTLKKLKIKVFCFAKTHPLCGDISAFREKTKKQCVEILRPWCLKGLELIKEIYKQNKFDMLILDEMNICVRDGFLKEKEVLFLLENKPEKLELVLTGRGATRKMIKKAGLVSYIKEVKHPYREGVQKRRGIEY